MRRVHKAAAAFAVSGALVLGGGIAAHAATISSTTTPTSPSSQSRSGTNPTTGNSGASGEAPAGHGHGPCPNM